MGFRIGEGGYYFIYRVASLGGLLVAMIGFYFLQRILLLGVSLIFIGLLIIFAGIRYFCKLPRTERVSITYRSLSTYTLVWIIVPALVLGVVYLLVEPFYGVVLILLGLIGVRMFKHSREMASKAKET